MKSEKVNVVNAKRRASFLEGYSDLNVMVESQGSKRRCSFGDSILAHAQVRR